jgi:hypothetical protein
MRLGYVRISNIEKSRRFNYVFPLGRTDGGCLIWWYTASEPKNWTIVVYDENSWNYEKYDMQLCEFLYKYFTKQITCKGFRIVFVKKRSFVLYQINLILMYIVANLPRKQQKYRYDKK